MKRTKRFTLRRIAVGLAVAAIAPAAAQARPMDMDGSDFRLLHAQAVAKAQTNQTVEIPYLSHGVGVTAAQVGVGTSKSPDDRAFSRQSPVDFWNYDSKTGEKIADSSPGVAPGDLAKHWSGSPAEKSVEPTPGAAETGGYDVGGTVGGLAIALLVAAGAAGGTVVARRRHRSNRLAPA
jgi:hypothetical protein